MGIIPKLSTAVYPGLRVLAIAMQEAARRAVKSPGSVHHVILNIESVTGTIEFVYNPAGGTSLPILNGKGKRIHSLEELFGLKIDMNGNAVVGNLSFAHNYLKLFILH